MANISAVLFAVHAERQIAEKETLAPIVEFQY
jgi:hypothetical protein